MAENRPGPKASNPERDLYALAILQRDPMSSREAIAKEIMKRYPDTPISTARQVVDRAFRDMADEGKMLRPFRKHRVRQTLEEIVRRALQREEEAWEDGRATATWLGAATTALKRLAELDALEEPTKTEVSVSYENYTPHELQSQLKSLMLKAAAEGNKSILDLASAVSEAQQRHNEGAESEDDP